jgi:SAM-dependent methyltransferase
MESSADFRTLDEPWYTSRKSDQTAYTLGADFALEHLQGPGSCLVIGSPLFEALELRAAGWSVSYVDVREPPVDVGWVRGDARELPFDDMSFDAVSTNCVICHVGLGRYGDDLDEHGDDQMLTEIRRVLKPGGLAAVGFGPVIGAAMPMLIKGNQRMFTVLEAQSMALRSRLEIIETRVMDYRSGSWAPQPVANQLDIVGRKIGGQTDYLMMLLRRS